MNLQAYGREGRGRGGKFRARRPALIRPLDAMRSSSERGKKNTCLTISELPFNRRNRSEPLKCGVTAKCCVHGRCFFAETIARSRYDGGDKLTGSFCDRASF